MRCVAISSMRRRWGPGVAVLLSLTPVLYAAPVPSAGHPPAKLAALQTFSWYDGSIEYSSVKDCAGTVVGDGIGAYVGFCAAPEAAQPSPSLAYYVHVVVAGRGNACSCTRAYIDIALPANTSLAIDASHRIYRYCDFDLVPDAETPQETPPSIRNPGAYQLPSGDAVNDNTWSVPQGRIIEIQIPVISSSALSNGALQANVCSLDGSDGSWLHPRRGVFVFGMQPAVVYPTHSTNSVTASAARSQVTLYTNGAGGAAFFDLGTTTAYVLVHEPVSVAAGATSTVVWHDWGPALLTPGTLYHWRCTFTTGGETFSGEDQTFTTLADNLTTDTEVRVTLSGHAARTGGIFDIMGRSLSWLPDRETPSRVAATRGGGSDLQLKRARP